MKLGQVPNDILISNLKTISSRERNTTVDVIEHIAEFISRRLYFELGHTSVFSYLTKELLYSEASAQSRIDAARLLQEIPYLSDKLRSGETTLTQVSILARSLRQKEREVMALKRALPAGGFEAETETEINKHDQSQPAGFGFDFSDETKAERKRQLIEKMAGLDSKASALIIAQELDLDVKTFEKAQAQKDESVRLEMTLTKDQMAMLRRIKDLTSHRNPISSWADVIEVAASAYLKREDPMVEKPSRKNKSTSDTKFECEPRVASDRKILRKAIPISIRRSVFRRDGGVCQWQNPKTGERCRPTFQLELDHVEPVHAGGGNEIENLRVLCDAHNRWRFLREG